MSLDNAELTRRANTVDDALKEKHRRIHIQEVADILGISKTAAYNTMEKWVGLGIVERVEYINGYSDWYWIGVR